MASINLLENPVQKLNKQKKLRIRICVGLLLGCLLVFASVITHMEFQKHVAVKNMSLIEEKLTLMQPALKQKQKIQQLYEARLELACAAKTLGEIINTPIKGVTLFSLAYDGEWLISGRVSDPAILSTLESIFSGHLENVALRGSALYFEITGASRC